MHTFFSLASKSLSLCVLCIGVASLNPQSCQANAPNQKSAFKGFYVGGNLGYVSGLSREHFQATAAPGSVSIAANNKSGLEGVDGGINLGYTYVFPCSAFALGLEGVANWSNVRGKHTFSATTGAPPTQTNFTAHAQMKQSLQLMGRLGYVLGRAMPFLKLGWDNSSWEIKSKANISSPFFPAPLVLSHNKRKRINGIAYGAGIDVSLQKCIIAGLEYTRVDFQSQNQSFAGGGSAKASYKPHSNKFALTLKVLFP